LESRSIGNKPNRSIQVFLTFTPSPKDIYSIFINTGTSPDITRQMIDLGVGFAIESDSKIRALACVFVEALHTIGIAEVTNMQ